MTAPQPASRTGPKAPAFRFAARSDTGLVRKNNQDSGYAGAHFLLIADGMGGHAGGDVASAITVSRLTFLDEPDFTGDDLETLRDAVLAANAQIIRAVQERPELAGMGTTVSALLQTGDRLALAHIGDSRAFVMHKGELKQVTHDHTFVQMLVDEGRITPEEAETHPQRSVVMRVLGDVGAAPELDMSFHEAIPGDRWMLCSDGLTGFASLEDIHEALASIEDPGECCEKLIELALAGGGADNVTVVVGDVLDPEDDVDIDDFGEAVGSIRLNPAYALIGGASAHESDVDTGQYDVILDESHDLPTAEVPVEDISTQPLEAHQVAAGTTAGAAAPADGEQRTLELDPSARADVYAAEAAAGQPAEAAPAREDAGPAASEDPADAIGRDADASGTAPAAQSRAERRAARRRRRSAEDLDDDLADWGEETERPRRRIAGLVIALVVVLGLIAAGFLGWRYVQSQYYVTESEGTVAVYQGLPQTLGPIELSSLTEETEVSVTELSTFSQQRLEATIPADSREAALAVVETLRAEAERNAQSMEGQTSGEDAQDPAPSPSPAQGGAVQGGVTDESSADSSLSPLEDGGATR
ncbi:PP2C family protein-serine/threonine phosphatase [Brevibacterium album]|uniref:PP2C family protein-serine/threonine phosphatase n=1 Tax=Brevibacterium album TaxID=417948 RepID=UPI00041E4B5B|nr:PP2C family serine/threonine-protein phosphatase [Brevibacterium album]